MPHGMNEVLEKYGDLEEYPGDSFTEAHWEISSGVQQERVTLGQD